MSTTDVETGRFDNERLLGLINYGLLFSSIFFAGVPALVAVILAYIQRPTVGPVMREHYRFQIWIFWIGVLLGAVGGVSLTWAILDVIAQGAGGHLGPEGWVLADFDVSDVHATGRMIALFVISGLALTAMFVWMLAMPVVGFVRLLSGRAEA
ncbi:MAG TPA: hypothetical protein VEA44_11760 [Caulobacter sp.]|nr:hypothetical protein [Caulobacter sp.]